MMVVVVVYAVVSSRLVPSRLDLIVTARVIQSGEALSFRRLRETPLAILEYWPDPSPRS